MTHHPAITGALLVVAVAIAIVSAVGMAVVRDTLQRLHFSAMAVSLSASLIVVAVFIEQAAADACIKVVLIAVLLFLMNSILTHATARAVRVRRTGNWIPAAEEHVATVGHAHRAAGHARPRRRKR